MSNCWPPDTLRSRNGTFNSTEDERSQLEDRIKEIIRNETSDAITEDDGGFVFFLPLLYQPPHTTCPHRKYLGINSWAGHQQFHFQPNDAMKSGRNKFVSVMCLLDAFAETFQEQETMFSSVIKTKCHRDQLEIYGHRWCVYPFHQAMTLISPEDWCVLENVIRYEPLWFIAGVLNSNTQLANI